jgi:hypothetical protein
MKNLASALVACTASLILAACSSTSPAVKTGVSAAECQQLDPVASVQGQLPGSTTADLTISTRYADGTTSGTRFVKERANDELAAATIEAVGFIEGSVTRYVITPTAVYVKFPADTLEDVDSTEWMRFTNKDDIGATMLENAGGELSSGSVLPADTNLGEWISQTSELLDLSSATVTSAGASDGACRFELDADGMAVSVATDGSGRVTKLEASTSPDTDVTLIVGYVPVDVVIPTDDELAPDSAVTEFVERMNLESVETSALSFNRELTSMAAQLAASMSEQVGANSGKSTRNGATILETLGAGVASGAQNGPAGVTIMAPGAKVGAAPVVIWDGAAVPTSASESIAPYPAYLQFVKWGASVCLRLSDDASSAADTTAGGTPAGKVVGSANISDGDTGAGWIIMRRASTGSKVTAAASNACNGVKTLTGTPGGTWSVGSAMTGW